MRIARQVRPPSRLLLAFGLLWLTVSCSWNGEDLKRYSASKTADGTASGSVLTRRDLSVDEARGGHTLAKHVAKSDEELRARLDHERIAAASTYTDLNTAERTVGAALQRESDRVHLWTQRSGKRPNLAIEFRGDPGKPVGRTLRRGDSRSWPCANAVVVLKSDGANGYYVLTSYPECR